MNLQAKAKSKYEGGSAIGGNHCDQTRVIQTPSQLFTLMLPKVLS
jgi:hypothetical protein